MNDELKEKIIQKVKDNPKAIKEIAKSLFISKHQVLFLLKEWGVELPKSRKYKKVDRPERDVLMKIYNELGTTPKVAERFEVGTNTVNRWMKELTIPTRKMVGMEDEDKKKFLEDHLNKLENIDL
jgi:transposase